MKHLSKHIVVSTLLVISIVVTSFVNRQKVKKNDAAVEATVAENKKEAPNVVKSKSVFEVADSICQEAGVPFELVKEIGNNESGWRYISNTNGGSDHGDLQVIDATFWYWYKKLELEGGKTRRNYLKVGIYYLKSLHNKTGSGMDGMITSKDVDNFSPPSASTPLSSFPAASPQDLAGSGIYSDAEASNMRKVIAKRLQQSKHEIPHYYLTVECNMDKIMGLRKEINTTYEKEGVKLSVNDFVIKAVALSCKRVPECNSSWMDTFIRTFHTCDVSVAVDTGNGLITPIVTSVESKGLAEISMAIKDMAGRAKEGRLAPHEYQGGTITVSNLGMFGINQFTAIINPPQACILAVGGTERKVVPGIDGVPTVANMMRVTMSCDHRVVDGAVGAQWLQHFKKFMENPQAMLL
jgi:hypothetical protein